MLNVRDLNLTFMLNNLSVHTEPGVQLSSYYIICQSIRALQEIFSQSQLPEVI